MAVKLAYLMSRFPKISETFILHEILELQKLGIRIEIFPLVHEHESAVHPEAEPLVKRAHYPALFSTELLSAQFYWFRKSPLQYSLVWLRAFRGNITSARFLLRSFVVIPVAALFARKIKQLGISHVHAHWATHPALAAWVIHQLTGLPYSFTAHAHDIYVERPMLGEKIRKASFVVTISDYNKQLLQGLYGESANVKIHVVHCGVDPESFQPKPLRGSKSDFTILCVASLSDYKGQAYLVDACSLLRRRGIDFRCLLIGEGDCRGELEKRIRDLHLERQIQLLGWKPHQQVREYMARADVVVLPSVTTITGKKEGIPVALMEALAMEVPAVSTSISGIGELVQDEETGLLVPERDPIALANAITRLQKNPELGRRLGHSGRRKVLMEFNLHKNAQTLAKLFGAEMSAITMQAAPSRLTEWKNQGAAQC